MAADLTPAERVALSRAARLASLACEVLGDPELQAGYQRMADRLAEPEPPHACVSCGTSIEKCDGRIRRGWSACCSLCALQDTHGDTPTGYAERERARRADTGLVAPPAGPDVGTAALLDMATSVLLGVLDFEAPTGESVRDELALTAYAPLREWLDAKVKADG